MKCPKCQSAAGVRTLDSRETSAGRRRRHACSCGGRFSTIEILIEEVEGLTRKAKAEVTEEIWRVLLRHGGVK